MSNGPKVSEEKGAPEGAQPGGISGLSGQSSFGAGAGWVVVAFISPIGMDVSELAVRMLRGPSAQAAALGRVKTQQMATFEDQKSQKTQADGGTQEKNAEPSTTR